MASEVLMWERDTRGGREVKKRGWGADPIRSTDSQVWIIKIRNWIEEGDGVCTSPGIQHHQLPSERVASAARIRSKKKNRVNNKARWQWITLTQSPSSLTRRPACLPAHTRRVK
jgi:hypothetical protein